METDRSLRMRMERRKLSHAYLVTGEERRALADTLAAAWVCTGDRPPCGTCTACRKAGKGIHPDIRRYDTEGNGLKAEQVRALRSDAYILPNEAPCKVYVLEHGELLNTTGQNILLKLIEEGPPYARFLFLTQNPEDLLPTVRSRCETLRSPGTEERRTEETGEKLADLILRKAGPEETLPLLFAMEKMDREGIALLLDGAIARLTAALPERPELLAAADRLSTVRRACNFNIGVGHLAGWIVSSL